VTTISYSSTQYTTITKTRYVDASETFNPRAARALATQITTVPLMITTVNSACTSTIAFIGGIEQRTVTQFVDLPVTTQQTTSTEIVYEGTVTVTLPIPCTLTVADVTSTVFVTETPPPVKVRNKIREMVATLTPRDLVYTTTLTILATTTENLCVTSLLTAGTEKITVTVFVSYPTDAKTSQTTSLEILTAASVAPLKVSSATPLPALNPTSAATTEGSPSFLLSKSSPVASPGVSSPAPLATFSPTPTASLGFLSVTSPVVTASLPISATRIPLQPGETIITTFESSPLTFIQLSSGLGAVVNDITYSLGGAPTTVGDIILTYASSGLIAEPLQATPTLIPLPKGETITTIIGSSILTFLELPSGSGAVIDDVTYSAGGAPTTVNNIVLTYGSSGLIAIPSPTQGRSQPGDIITTTIGSTPLAFVQLPSGSGAVVSGATLSAGGAAITINGVIVTYGPSGLLTIPSSTASTIGLGGIIMSMGGFSELREYLNHKPGPRQTHRNSILT